MTNEPTEAPEEAEPINEQGPRSTTLVELKAVLETAGLGTYADRLTGHSYDALLRYWNGGAFGAPDMQSIGLVLHVSGQGTVDAFDWRVFIGTAHPGHDYERMLARIIDWGHCLPVQDARALIGPASDVLADLPYRH